MLKRGFIACPVQLSSDVGQTPDLHCISVFPLVFKPLSPQASTNNISPPIQTFLHTYLMRCIRAAFCKGLHVSKSLWPGAYAPAMQTRRVLLVGEHGFGGWCTRAIFTSRHFPRQSRWNLAKKSVDQKGKQFERFQFFEPKDL